MGGQLTGLGVLINSLETLLGKLNREIKVDDQTSIPQSWDMRTYGSLKIRFAEVGKWVREKVSPRNIPILWCYMYKFYNV